MIKRDVMRIAIFAVICAALAACVPGVGVNSLVIPVTQKAVELAGYGVDAAKESVFGPKPAPEPVKAEDMQVKAEATCTEHKLSEADCQRVHEQYAKVADFVTRIQGIEVVADEQRKEQRAEALKPGNIVKDVVGGAVGQTMMLEQAGMAGDLSRVMH